MSFPSVKTKMPWLILDFSLHVFSNAGHGIGSDFFRASNDNINVNWKRNWTVFFEATFLFLILFTEVLADKKPHHKTTEEVKIHLLTITILNTGNYRIVKRELKNFAKKENIGTNKKNRVMIQAKMQDKLYLRVFGNSGYNRRLI